MGVDGHKKGGKNERAVAKMLSEWTGQEFARVPQSGGLAWKNRLQVTGDVIATDPKLMVTFPFSVEAKFHAEIDFEAPLLGQNTNWMDWWDQACNDATRSKKLPIVIMRRNKMPRDEHYCILDIDTFEELDHMVPGFKHPRGYYIWREMAVIFPVRDLMRANYLMVEQTLQQFINE